MTTPRTPVNLPALVTAVLGIGCLVAGALWPWLTSPVGPLGTPASPWLLWLTVAAGIAAVVTAHTGASRRWLLVLVAITVVAAVGARASVDPGWMCWDGVDADGNMIGGCEDDRWTLAPVVFAIGVALTVVATWLARRASRTDPTSAV